MGSEAGQSTAADHGPMAGDEDHSMLDGNMDVDLPDARTAVDTATATAKPTATVEEEQSPRTNATKEERSNEVVPKASQAGVRPDEAGLKAPGAVAPPKAVTKSVPPTARRAPPTSRAPTARAAVL